MFVALIGLAIKPLHFLFDYAWFVGFAVSFLVHWALMNGRAGSGAAEVPGEATAPAVTLTSSSKA